MDRASVSTKANPSTTCHLPLCSGLSHTVSHPLLQWTGPAERTYLMSAPRYQSMSRAECLCSAVYFTDLPFTSSLYRDISGLQLTKGLSNILELGRYHNFFNTVRHQNCVRYSILALHDLLVICAKTTDYITKK